MVNVYFEKDKMSLGFFHVFIKNIVCFLKSPKRLEFGGFVLVVKIKGQTLKTYSK